MSLEYDVTKGSIVYIREMSFNPEKGQLAIVFMRDLERRVPISQLIFHNVENYEIYVEPDHEADDVESLIGLSEYAEEKTIRYVIKTDDIEIIFTSTDPPSFEEIVDNKGMR